ncbi:MAG: V-type ATP synthase subunit F [Candidatus Hodarchaeales archaeon]|jgi:vacuolar-type H+-ATPase subunit F/Vma7
MNIALIADDDTINFFKLGGLEHVFVVNKPEEAEKYFRDFLEKREFIIVITTDNIANKNRALVNEIIEEHEFPIIISIPTLGGTSQPVTDTITELIRRKTGIELKSE